MVVLAFRLRDRDGAFEPLGKPAGRQIPAGLLIDAPRGIAEA